MEILLKGMKFFAIWLGITHTFVVTERFLRDFESCFVCTFREDGWSHTFTFLFTSILLLNLSANKLFNCKYNSLLDFLKYSKIINADGWSHVHQSLISWILSTYKTSPVHTISNQKWRVYYIRTFWFSFNLKFFKIQENFVIRPNMYKPMTLLRKGVTSTGSIWIRKVGAGHHAVSLSGYVAATICSVRHKCKEWKTHF